MYFSRWSLARRLFMGNLLFVLAVTAVVSTVVLLDARGRTYSQAAERMLSIATSIADSPLVEQAALSPDPSALLQPYALEVMADARADFITIMAPDRTRWTHPDPTQLGKPYIGSVDEALAGHSYTETTQGTLGPSVRAIVPVKDSAGTVVAMVAAGVTVSTLDVALNARLPAIAGMALALMAGGSLLAWLLGRYLRRVTLGWGPERLGQLFAYYESVLHSVRDGLVLVDPRGELVMYNDQAAALLGIEAPTDGRRAPQLDTLELTPSLAELLRSGRTAVDELHLTPTRLLVVSQHEARPPGAPARRGQNKAAGTVATLQDHTALKALDDELRSSKTLTDALRAQTHEHANRIHTLVSLLELGRTQEALDFATADLALSQRLADNVLNGVDEPVASALLMGKISQASERGIDLRVNVDAGVHAQPPGGALGAHDMVTILGNLIDNALDAAAAGTAPRWVEVSIGHQAQALVLTVADSGGGLDSDAAGRLLRLGYTTKGDGGYGHGIGLALVHQTVQHLGGTLSMESSPGAVFTVVLPDPSAGSTARPGPSSAQEPFDEY
ncbi:sensor histidine kinase [Arthrobacter sp. 35W]|uniref:sensor histidine kinase n=1 Tax=Arthrobacter sp. 35W TaxID=1132441 RepID=UPI0003FC738A|nr:sensor histidine kinase [Arthrobacter sp. 35W]